MLRHSLAVVFVVGLTVALPAFGARTWHVAGDGSDTAAGTSPATAFRSLSKVAALVEPGDVVLIGDGVYTESVSTMESSVLEITRSGRPDAWITWKARPGSHPDIRPTGWNGIMITGSYHIIDGLTVTGRNDEITLIDAQADSKNAKASARFNTNGIYVNGRLREPDEKPHHVIIRHCTVSKCPGAGINMIETDYITVEDCVVFENAWFMRYGGSGISTLDNWAHDDALGYHMIIQRNLSWNNHTTVAWEKVGRLSDGNGIIIDVTDQEQSAGALNPNADKAIPAAGTSTAANVAEPRAPAKPPRPVWRGRTLVANNLSAFNGGSGIHTFRAAHVDIVNNTTYWNGQIVGYPELFSNNSTDVVILNNIIVPRPGGKVTSNNRNTDVRWDFNLYPIKQDVVSGPNDLVATPNFVRVRPDLREADFHLQRGSPGRDDGTDLLAQPNDLAGKKRPIGRGRDRGAFEQ